jgi:protein TonB
VDPSLAKEALAPVNDRLVTTLFLAALFHGIVILGVSFSVASLGDPDDIPTLEVLLVNEQMPEALDNRDADYLAQRSQHGSGNTRAGRTSNPPSSPMAFDNPGVADGQALADREAGRPSEAASMVAAPAEAGARFGESVRTDSGPQHKALLMRTGPSSPLPSADEGELLVLKGEDSAVLMLTPNARQADVAVYLAGWKHKVERVGTLHFPQETRRQDKSGNPVLEVAIRADGQLHEARVRRSSGHADLDQAALAILRLAAPFGPFPAELRTRHPLLRFAYEWQFLGGRPAGSTVRSR